MVTRPTSASRRGRAADLILHRPGAAVALLLPFGIAAQLLIDRVLGETAEYYDAFALVEAWWHVITSGDVDQSPTFIIGQERLGQPAALAVGTLLLVVQPAIVLGVVVFTVNRLLRWSGGTNRQG